MKTKTKPKPVASVVTDQVLPLKQLVEAPYNPRKVFLDEELQEIAGSMKALGVLQPLAVRALIGGKSKNPLYEIISGHKRKRAAEIAGLKEVPCRVFEVDDKQALGMAIVANLHSAPSALEKAESLRDLIEKHSLTTDQAAEFLGESVGGIRALMRLRNLPKIVTDAVNKGTLPIATAGLIAGLPAGQHQDQLALHVLTGMDYGEPKAEDVNDYDDPLTFKATQDLIAKKYQRQLKGAPWPLALADLVPGVGSCSACPQKGGNLIKTDAERYGHLRADMCLEPACYLAKKTAWIDRLEEEAKGKGWKVLKGHEALDLGQYWSLYYTLDGKNASGNLALGDCKTLRDYLKDKGIALEKLCLAINPDGRTAEGISKDYVQAQLNPVAPSPHPSPEGKKPKKAGREVVIPPPEAAEVETSAPEAAAEPTGPKLAEQFDQQGRGEELATPRVKIAIRNLLSALNCGPGISKGLQAAALALVEFEVDMDPTAFLNDMAEERGIDFQAHRYDSGIPEPWRDWIEQAPAASLIALLMEIPTRQALDGLPDKPACRALLSLAGLTREGILAEIEAERETAAAAG